MNQALTRLCAALLASSLGFKVYCASVSLAWDANTEEGIVGYRVYFSRLPAKTEVVDVGNVTSVTVSNLMAGFLYSFYATAYNADGLESAPSTILEYLVPGLPIPVDLGPVQISKVAMEPEGLAITFPTLAGVSYLIEANENFPGDNWNTVASAIIGTGLPVTIIDTRWNSAARQVYRIAAAPMF